jgi:hypothetical protein
MNDYEIVTLLPWNPTVWLIVTLGLLVGLIGLCIILGVTSLQRRKREGIPEEKSTWQGTVAIICGAGAFFTLIFGVIAGCGISGDVWDSEQRARALEELGYYKVSVSSDEFQGALDGFFMEGRFVELDPRTHEFAVFITEGPGSE